MEVRQSGINNYRSQGLYLSVPVYYHRAQVAFIDTESTYIYNTVRAWFNSMRLVLLGGEPRNLKQLKLKGWDLWEGYNKQKRYVYKLFNPGLGIEVYTYSIKNDSPIIFRITGKQWKNKPAFEIFKAANEYSPNTDDVGAEPTVIEVSKRWDRVTKKVWVQVDVFITGNVFEAEDALKWVLSLMHRQVDFTFNRVYVVRLEQFTRVHEKAEKAVIDAMQAFAEKWGDRKTGVENKHPEAEGRQWATWVFRLSNIHLSEFRADLKLYRKKKYNYPAIDLSDHPKLEVVHYHVDYSPEAVAKAEREGREIIASIIEAANAYDALLPDNEHPVAGYGVANPLIVKAINEEDLKRRFSEFAPVEALQLDSKERYILMQLMDRRLESEDLKQIAERLGVSVRTVQNKIKRLVDLELAFRFRTKGNKWVYLFNFDRVRPREPELGKPELQQVLGELAEPEPIDVSKLGNKVLATYILIKHGHRSTAAISRVLGVTRRQVRNYIRQLREAGLVEAEKRGRHVFYKANGYPSHDEVAASAATENYADKVEGG
uniref:Putative Rep protein n=1 Tax=Pyrococcus sp. JT1 TaxID=165215 RepID=Q977V6_9EURY|nr:HTH domain-containing protein [Pyrococcus sp. JT1]AAK73821.1 putative Rep protein [Pyrococcus sp. JT1]